MNIPDFEFTSNYFWGVGGSVSVELVAAVRSAIANGGECPPLYKKPFYLFARVLLALAAGMVPILLSAQTALTAFYVGASAPLFFDKAASGVDLPKQ